MYVQDLLVMIFRIPNLHGFQFILIFCLLVIFLGFSLLSFIEESIFRKWSEKGQKLEEEVLSVHEETPESLKSSLVSESSDESFENNLK